MSSTRNALRKRLLAGGAAIALSLSAVGCAEGEETGGGGESAATAENGGGGGDTADAADPAEATGEAGDAAGGEAGETGAGGDTTEVEAADGSMIEIPAAAAEAAESAGFGAPQSVEEGPNGESLVAYEGGDYIVHSEEAGAQPLVGMIAETWTNEGGFDAGVGLPTAPEMANEDGNGWTQEFTNGTIAWTADESGEYSADIQTN